VEGWRRVVRPARREVRPKMAIERAGWESWRSEREDMFFGVLVVCSKLQVCSSLWLGREVLGFLM
jgi:hypothetical protein